MAMRLSFQFVLYVARNILLHVLYLIYCVLYKMLEVVETCCWHVDNWREDHITTKGSVRDVSIWLQILNWFLRRCWKGIMRLSANIYILYMNISESGRFHMIGDYQILTCIDSDGPSPDFCIN